MFKKFRRWWGRPSNPAGNVYYARLRTPQGTFYKLGYTAKSTLVDRMAYGNNGDEKLIDCEFFFTFRENAWDVEQTLLEHFDKQRAFGKFSKDPTMPLSGRGQSELFAQDVLGLDDDAYKLPSIEAISAMQERQEQSRDGCFLLLVGLILLPFTLGLSLILIFWGASGVFSTYKGRQSTATTTARPNHPQAIRDLVDSLVSGRSF